MITKLGSSLANRTANLFASTLLGAGATGALIGGARSAAMDKAQREAVADWEDIGDNPYLMAARNAGRGATGAALYGLGGAALGAGIGAGVSGYNWYRKTGKDIMDNVNKYRDWRRNIEEAAEDRAERVAARKASRAAMPKAPKVKEILRDAKLIGANLFDSTKGTLNTIGQSIAPGWRIAKNVGDTMAAFKGLGPIQFKGIGRGAVIGGLGAGLLGAYNWTKKYSGGAGDNIQEFEKRRAVRASGK